MDLFFFAIFSVVAEGITIVSCTSFEVAVSVMMQVYFIFNMEYPPSAAATLDFNCSGRLL